MAEHALSLLILVSGSGLAQTPAVDLSVGVTASPNPVAAGSSLTYSVSVLVPSGVATGVTVMDILPAGVTYVSGTPGCANNQGTVTCLLGALGAGTATVTIVVTPPQAGTITNVVGVIANEPDSNMSNNSAAATTTVTGTACGITSINPNAGSVAGGQTTVIRGGCFTGATDVQFQSAFAMPPGDWHVDSATQITVLRTPAVPIGYGPVNVTVVTPGGSYTLPNGYTYYYPPTISTINPTSGPTSGGTSVTITGTYLTGVTVTFGGTAATVTSSSYSQATVTAPAHAAGTVGVLVSNPGGSASRTYTYTGAGWTFTDDPLTAGVTTVKAVHVTELRQDIDALRARVGLGGAPWRDNPLQAGVTAVKAIHVQDLRTYLDDVLTRLGYATSPYADPGLTTGYAIRKVHIDELRQRIRIVPN